jgi:hypothetical protein
MSRGIAQRKGAKAARRKKLLAERRSLGPANPGSSLARRMRALAGARLKSCLIQEGLFERGNGLVVLIREAGFGASIMVVFLVDVFCLGVKEVVVREGEDDEIKMAIDSIGLSAPFAPVEPSYARKLMRDLVAWSRSLGIEPAAEYAAADLLFGDISADSCDADFVFGQDGKPFYMPGPNDTPSKIRRQIERLERRLGSDGFEFFVPLEDDDFEDDGDEDYEPETYDPDLAPDPEAWLAAGERERIGWVEDYQRRAGIDPPNATALAAFIAAVENQIAADDPPTIGPTVERLTAEGLHRGEAIIAVAGVLAEFVNIVLKGDETADISNAAYAEAVNSLTADGWRRAQEAEDEAEEG